MNTADSKAAMVAVPATGFAFAEVAPPRAGRLTGYLTRWCDPEWPLLTGLLFLPTVAFWAFGHGQQASFFAGAAVFISVLKWLGWALFTRRTLPRDPYLFFPAELFVGLAALAAWFYLRNVLNALWPGSYSLRELGWLFPLVLVLHLAGCMIWFLVHLSEPPGLSRRDAGGDKPRRSPKHSALVRGLGQRLALYGPFCLALVMAFWSISGTLSVQGTDAIHHTFAARIYLTEGLDFVVPSFGVGLHYPSGYGALNAVAGAAAPLTVVQAFHLIHVLLCLACLFLITAALAHLAGRSLGLLHSLPLLFLTIFPLYTLYPDIFYSGTPKQVGPPFWAAMCLLPLFADATRKGNWLACMAAVAVLGALAIALNPACAPFTALAGLAALAVLARRAKAEHGPGRLRTAATLLILTVLAAGLVLGPDPYYRSLVARSSGPSAAAASPEPPADAGAFSPARGRRYAMAISPLGLSPAVSTTFLSAQADFLKNWTDKFPQLLLPWLAVVLGLLTLGPTLVARRRGQPVPPLATVTLTSLLAFFLLKYAVNFAAGGLAITSAYTMLLSAYSRYLLVRCELLLLFTSVLASGACLALAVTANGPPGRMGRAAAFVLTGLACWLLPLACFAYDVNLSGYLRVPTNRRYPVTRADVEFIAWVEDNVPPERGMIAVAAGTYQCGHNNEEKHIYPLASGVAAVLYGKQYHYRFLLPALEGDRGFDDYEAHVRQRLDVAWCRRANVRHFLVADAGLRENPGLAEAIRVGVLHPIGQGGSLTLYAVGHGD